MGSLKILVSLLVCFCLPALSQFTDEQLIFDAGDLGIIKGSNAQTTKTKRPYVQFLGIPFVEPVTSATRFLPPEEKRLPLAPEGQIFSATRKSACCPQLFQNLLCLVNQKEDCLGMNIYTPVVQNMNGTFDTLLPVIVFIHGGAFILGSGDQYSGARLLERDVVLVNFNYRLGAFGFFSLNTEDAPGNAGMYDMVEALRFVKRHIENFGGDPDRITIAGQSAGSVAVTHMMLSPLTRNEDLFHRAIAMSGSALLKWGTITSEEAVESSLILAENVGCYNVDDGSNDMAAVAECMRQKPTKDLVNALQAYQTSEKNEGRLGFAPAAPTIQTGLPSHIEPFMDVSPEYLLERQEQTNVPLMMGSVRHDGSFVLGVIYNQYIKFHGLQNNGTFLRTQFVRKCMEALGITNKVIVDALATAYLGREAKSSGNLTQMLPGLTDLHTVFFFKESELAHLNLHSQIQPDSYWYEFDFAGKRSVYSVLVNTDGNPVRGGIAHGDDVIYLFNVPLMSLTTPEEQGVSDRLVRYWANFAATGNPNIDENGQTLSDVGQEEWPAYREDSPSFFKIDVKDTVIPDAPFNYWNGPAADLYPELSDENNPGTTTISTSDPEITNPPPTTESSISSSPPAPTQDPEVPNTPATTKNPIPSSSPLSTQDPEVPNTPITTQNPGLSSATEGDVESTSPNHASFLQYSLFTAMLSFILIATMR